MHSAPQPLPERSGAFGGFIGPRTLVSLVESALPWLLAPAFAQRAGVAAPSGDGSLHELAAGPLGWWRVLRAVQGGRQSRPTRSEPEASEGAPLQDWLAPSEVPTPEQRTDYFALCLAAHFASAASFVPTDVDTKIRRALWREAVGTPELARMRALALGLSAWDVSAVSARQVQTPEGVVSGHDGERLSVLCGGLIASLRAQESEGAAELEAAIEDELAREARAFAELERARGSELDLVRLAGVLTHNAGDVMQGLAGAGKASLLVERFGDLARTGVSRYGGAFGRAAALYRALLASEGHRNYPLRGPRALRRVPELLLPIAPLLDDWGERIARVRELTARERAEIVEALALGCTKLPGQQGYYRALAGYARASARGLEAPEIAEHVAASTRRLLRASDLRQKIAVPRASFESQLAKRARSLLATRTS